MFLRIVVLFGLVLGFAYANPGIMVLGQFRDRDPGLANGVSALDSILPNIRILGNYGAKKEGIPSIHSFSTRWGEYAAVRLTPRLGDGVHAISISLIRSCGIG